MPTSESLKAKESRVAAILAMMLWAPAHSQSIGADAPQGELQEVVVTAQRREQRLQDVGVSISAVSAEELRDLGITDSRDISKAVPGVLLTGFGSGDVDANLTLRGISQGDVSSFQESPNSLYIDDVYLSSANAAAFQLYDLERIEVLRGPQGTLFGRASSGGLADFITARPTRDWEGYAETGYSSFNDAYGEAAIGGPISDSVRFRVSTRYERADGWFENGLPGNDATFAKRFFGIRVQLEADVTDKLKARFSISYDDNPRHDEGAYRNVPWYYVNGQPSPLPTNVNAYGTCPGCDLFGYRNTYTQWNKQDFLNLGFLTNTRISPTLYLTYDLGSATLSSITNYTKFHFNYLETDPSVPVFIGASIQNQELDQYSEELRINGAAGNLTYTGGLYSLHTTQSVLINYTFPGLLNTPYAYDALNYIHQNLTSVAPFGQLEYQLTKTLTGIVGARYSYDVKTFDSAASFAQLGSAYGGTGAESPPLLVYDFSQSTVGDLARVAQGLWSGKLGLNYKPAKDTLFYLDYSRGVKGAGFNSNGYAQLSNAQTPFKSEWLNAFEAGSKLEFLDRRVRLNTSAFYYDYHRFQGFSFDSLETIVKNYDGHFAGGEVELAAAPRKDVEFIFGASYLHTELYHVLTAYNGYQDQQSIMSPKWTLNGIATKRFDTPVGTLALVWDGNYIGGRYASVDNNAANFIPGSFIQDARVTLNIKNQGLQLAFFVNNISDRARMVYSYDGIASIGDVVQSYAPPRWIGFSIRKSF